MAEFTDYDKYDAMGLAELIRNKEISAEEVCQEGEDGSGQGRVGRGAR